MKNQFSALELHYMLKELAFLVDSKVDQIYFPSKKELIIQFFVSGKGKKILRIIVPKILFLVESRAESSNPSQFCLLLRKHLVNSRLVKLEQMEFERIIKFDFQTKSGIYSLVFEFFSSGNIIFVNKGKIIFATEYKKWKDRTIRPNEEYSYPKKEFNFLELKEGELKKLLHDSKRENLVKTLAVDLGLGGIFSEEACLLSKLNKNKNTKDITDKEINSLFKSLKLLKSKKINPNIFNKNNEIFDLVPFELELYKDLKKKQFKTYSEILSFYFSKEGELVNKQKFKSQLDKIQKIITEQKLDIKDLGKSIEENRKKAEIIYSNYNLIKEIIEEVNKASKKYTWKEIKDKLKGHKIIKELNPKDKAVILEL
jgi:predicted ribosome quality control (RQC) complex YloA/Tae2 family protein